MECTNLAESRTGEENFGNSASASGESDGASRLL
jgi:hypothetical protein